MHIEDIFEDLEANFAAASEKSQSEDFFPKSRSIRITTKSMVTKELIAPMIGLEFVAGLDLISPIWHMFSMASLSQVVFLEDSDLSLPTLRRNEIDLRSFLEKLPTPSQIRWRVNGAEDYLSTGTLHGVAQGLLFIFLAGRSQEVSVPISAIEQLSIESVDNLNGNF